MTAHAKLDGAATTWMVSANMLHFFKRDLYFLLYFGIVLHPDWWMDFDDLYVI